MALLWDQKEKIRWEVQQAKQRGAGVEEQKALVDSLLANPPSAQELSVPQESYQVASTPTESVAPESVRAAKVPTGSLFKLGLRETPEEKVAQFKKMYPDGDATLDAETGAPIFRMPGQSFWSGENWAGDTGEDLSSLRSLARNSREIPRIGGAVGGALLAAPLTGGTSLAALATTAIGAGAGRLAGGMAEEAVESGTGGQLQTPGEVFAQEGEEALAETAMDFGLGTVVRYMATPLADKGLNILGGMLNPRVEPAGVYRQGIVQGKGMRNRAVVDQERRQEARDALKLIEKIPGAELPGTVVTAPGPLETMVPGRFRDVMGRQTAQLSEAIPRKMDDIKGAVTDYAENMAAPLEEDALGGSLAGKIRKAKESEVANQQRQVRPEEGGAALQGLAKDWQKQTKQKENEFYARARQAFELERPQFDISGVQQVATPRRVTGEAAEPGTAVSPDVVKDINVAADPPGGLNTLDATVQALSPEQVNYEVLKDLRTQYGEIVRAESDPAADTPTKIAASEAWKRYQQLTKALRNPTTDAPEFVKAIGEASDYSAGRLGTLKTKAMNRLLTEESPAALIRDASFSSEDLITPQTASALTQMATKSPEKAEEAAQALRLRILFDPAQGGGLGSVKRLENLKGSNTELYEMLGGENLREQAYKWDELMSDPLMDAWRASAEPAALVDATVKQMTRAADTRRILRQVGGSGSEGAQELRTALIGTSLKNAMKDMSRTKVAKRLVASKSLDKEIAALKDSTAWKTILTGEDRSTLRGMVGVLRQAEKFGGADVGAALMGAQVAANMKNPATFLSAMGTLMTNTALGSVAMMPGSLRTLRRVAFGKQPLEAKLTSVIEQGIRGYERTIGDRGEPETFVGSE